MKSFAFVCVLSLLLGWASAAKSRVLVVFAHQEPQSFCFAMRNLIIRTLAATGHEVRVSDLVQLKMIESLDRTDFTEPYNSTYFLPQVEQAAANNKSRSTFAKELRLEHDKVEWANITLFVFPYYVMYVPSIIKSWMERVYSCGFAYCFGHSLKGKKAMVIYSTGAGKEYLKDIEPAFHTTINGQFSFMGMTPLKPFTAYEVPKITLKERQAYLAQLEKIVADIDNREPFTSPYGVSHEFHYEE